MIFEKVFFFFFGKQQFDSPHPLTGPYNKALKSNDGRTISKILKQFCPPSPPPQRKKTKIRAALTVHKCSQEKSSPQKLFTGK